MTLYRFVTVDPLKFLTPFGIGSWSLMPYDEDLSIV